MPSPPWSSPRGIEPVLSRWLESRYVKPCLTADELLAGSDASYADLPKSLSPGLVNALRARGIDKLYAHQARASADRRGQDS